MKRYQWITVIVIGFFLSGCASYRPIVDQQTVFSQAQYERDLRECQQYADQISPGQAALVGAGIGAGIGAIAGFTVGVIFNVNPGELAAAGAALGGLEGATRGGAGAGLSQIEVIKRCMTGRGYGVLQ
mgnify:CR=1 FL=1